MVCSNCGNDNPPGARFCAQCGHTLERACPTCGRPAPSDARFCPHCGAQLGEAATQAAGAAAGARQGSLERLRQQAGTELAQRMLAEGQRIEHERKLVTVLFADLVGSTALAEGLDPEEWHEVVSGAHQRISQAVYRYEGTIAQLLGDGVLAFFGAPLAHEDDAERALLAGLEIVGSIGGYAEELSRQGRVAGLQIRVGLNTGLVVVGAVGSDLHMEYLAVGDTVNLAARIQSQAEPGTVYVSQRTRRLAGSAFRFEDRGPVELKGKAEPVRLYRVAGRGDPARARGIEGLVGYVAEHVPTQELRASFLARPDVAALLAP